MSLDGDAYRRVVGHFATGVTVVTTFADGRHYAMTANSFTSVSLDPVLALVAVETRARFHDAVLASGTFAVNVLAEDQEDVSRWFATRGRPHDESYMGSWALTEGPATGAALLEGALAILECRTHATYPGGDHTLLVGEVLALSAPREGVGPLVYFKGRYRRLSPE
ncbi:MAG TPA: flavin reductase family protein [Frankiaceae bacterium]|jgi:flavin reductase (DIM6/NTAB) family NADH-FMN oxidoreductase RutF|nr:flavin reductase family protein [Frankiaceae bacterium]